MKLALIDYGAGNIFSLRAAFARLGVESFLAEKPELLSKADAVILPGVGEAKAAMTGLRDRGFLSAIKSVEKPFLGICLGMQLLGDFSEENETPCLDVLPFSTKRFEPGSGKQKLKVPQMGWNRIRALRSPLFKGVSENSFMYFANSYRVPESSAAAALSDYGGEYVASVSSANFHGVQFHPEKSADAGMRVLENFLSLAR